MGGWLAGWPSGWTNQRRSPKALFGAQAVMTGELCFLPLSSGLRCSLHSTSVDCSSVTAPNPVDVATTFLQTEHGFALWEFTVPRSVSGEDSHPLLSERDWFQDPLWQPESADAPAPECTLHTCRLRSSGSNQHFPSVVGGIRQCAAHGYGGLAVPRREETEWHGAAGRGLQRLPAPHTARVTGTPRLTPTPTMTSGSPRTVSGGHACGPERTRGTRSVHRVADGLKCPLATSSLLFRG